MGIGNYGSDYILDIAVFGAQIRMKIVVCVRTLNEELAIGRFCQCYAWADEILISDGGSSDKTLDIARQYPNTQIHHFPDKVWHTDKIFSNPRGKHINYLIDWAHREKADWIIFDDCDCVPTADLQKWGRNFMEYGNNDTIFAYRMFVLGKDRWFPEMSKKQSLWAWKATVPVRADEDNYTIRMQIPDVSKIALNNPYALLHYFYPNEETFQRKKEQYLLTGEVNKKYNPLQQFGRLEELPDWAVYEK